MDVKTALAERKSTRAFLDKEVPIDVINTIIEQAKTSPSGANTQPWQVAVVTGKSKTNLCNKLEETFRSGNKGAMDYHYYPTCLLYTSPSPRDATLSRMPSSA